MHRGRGEKALTNPGLCGHILYTKIQERDRPMIPRPQTTATESRLTSPVGAAGIGDAATLAGRFFRLYWWRTPAAVGLVEDCS